MYYKYKYSKWDHTALVIVN